MLTECIETDKDFIFYVLSLLCFQAELCRSLPKRKVWQTNLDLVAKTDASIDELKQRIISTLENVTETCYGVFGWS